MALGLNAFGIQVHQALHGYNDGHRLLACSSTLKARDQKTLLIMSDISGPSAVIGDDGYITGYPLPESGVYALACTWTATEMPRPGCVWTHTLLLDFADLAALPSMFFLVNGFRRPTTSFSAEGYELPLSIEDSADNPKPPDLDAGVLKRIIWALYEHPKERVVASNDDLSLTHALLIWAQQWPRLRRSFRFCTLSFGDRSTEANAFDLQFLPARERSIRSRFSGATDADRVRVDTSYWIREAIADLSGGTEGELRRFLRQVGGDLVGGRETFVPLCRLHQLLPECEVREGALDEAVELLNGTFDVAAANSLRSMLATAIVRKPGSLQQKSLNFVLKHLDLLKKRDLEQNATRLGSELWIQEPCALIKLLSETPPSAFVGEQTLRELSVDQLTLGLQRDGTMIPAVLKRRPELVEQPKFWTIASRWSENALDVLKEQPHRRSAALIALLASNREDIALEVVRICGGKLVLQAISRSASDAHRTTDTEQLSRWLAAALREDSAVADFLSADLEPSWILLFEIARMTYPDFVPNNVGDDPWWISVRNGHGELNEWQRQYMAAYLLARAFGYRSRNQAELIGFAFDAVYIPASQSRLDQNAWRVIEPRLPKAWFFDWDYCQRMRDGLVDIFVNRELSPSAFVRITRDEETFRELTRSAARTFRGRRFLWKALHSVRGENTSSERVRVLEDAIR